MTNSSAPSQKAMSRGSQVATSAKFSTFGTKRRRWLAHEVLPTLRRTGSNSVGAAEEPQKLDGQPIAVLNVKLAMIREARSI